MARLARDPEVEGLIAAYRADLIAAGHFAENEVTSPARAFLLRIGAPAGWSLLSLGQQCAVSRARESALVTWTITVGHVRATPEFLARQRALGQSPAAEAGLLRDMPLIALDMRTTQVTHRRDLGRLVAEPQRELAQRPLDVRHRARTLDAADLPGAAAE
jgi:hypothetical protein